MEFILIAMTLISIIIPSITVIEWVKYSEEIDIKFTTVEENKEVLIYDSRLETEADIRMCQANMFYKKGVCW